MFQVGDPRTRSIRLFFVLLCVLPCSTFTGGAATPLEAQGWTADVYAGRADFETVPSTASSANAAAFLGHSQENRFLRLGLAAPVGSDAVLWGSATAGDRIGFRRGRFVLGADLNAESHGQRDPVSENWGWGARGEVLPLVSASAGPFVAQARAGRSWYEAEIDGSGWSRNVWISDLRLMSFPLPSIRLEGSLRHLREREADYTFVGISGTAAIGDGVLWASIGDWSSGLGDDVESVAWRIGGSVALRPSTELWLTLRQEPFDPLFLSAPRTSWGIGITYRLGSSRSPPSTVGPEQRAPGRMVIRLPLSLASSPPSIAGDFTGWQPATRRWGARSSGRCASTRKPRMTATCTC